MDASKEFLKKNDILPFISFKDTGKHTIKLLEDKEDTIKDKDSGKDVAGVTYIVKEGDEKKKFFTSSIGLISKLSDFEPSSVVEIEMKSKKVGNDWQSYFVVKDVNAKKEESVDDIPTEDII